MMIFKSDNVYSRAVLYISQKDRKSLNEYYKTSFKKEDQWKAAIYKLVMQLIADQKRNLADIKFALSVFIDDIDNPMFRGLKSRQLADDVDFEEGAIDFAEFQSDSEAAVDFTGDQVASQPSVRDCAVYFALCGLHANCFTILHQAACSNKPDVFAYLLEKFSFYLEIYDGSDKTVLDYANESGNTEIITLLNQHIEKLLIQATADYVKNDASMGQVDLIRVYFASHWIKLMQDGAFGDFQEHLDRLPELTDYKRELLSLLEEQGILGSQAFRLQ
jgi:hypothetical protein